MPNRNISTCLPEALERWLDEQKGEGLARVVLRRRTEGGAETLAQWPLARANAGKLAASIRTSAEDDTLQRGGEARYVLQAYRRGEKRAAGRMRLTMPGAPSREPAASEKAGPERSYSGRIVGLLMEHTQASAQLALGHTSELLRHYKDESERKDARIRELEENQAKVLRLHEELLSARHERELQIARAKSSEKRKDYLFDRLDTLLPIALSKLVPPSSAPALGEEIMRQFLKSLTREQLGGMVGHLNPEQAALVHEIYVAYCEREEKRDGTKANGAPTPVGGARAGAQHQS